MLWSANASAFNDPFDSAATVIAFEPTQEERRRLFGTDPIPGGHEFIEVLKAFREGNDEGLKLMQRTCGVICFAPRFDDMLMWSHYADCHRGCCFEFATGEEPFRSAVPVMYVEKPPTTKISTLFGMTPKQRYQLHLRNVLLKAGCWAHENEWRAVTSGSGIEMPYGTGALRAVYCGVRMETAFRKRLEKALMGSGVVMYEMELLPEVLAVRPRTSALIPAVDQTANLNIFRGGSLDGQSFDDDQVQALAIATAHKSGRRIVLLPSLEECLAVLAGTRSHDQLRGPFEIYELEADLAGREYRLASASSLRGVFGS